MILSYPISTHRRVKQVNPWLTYAEPLHRIREMGIGLVQLPVLHTVAKRKLSQREVHPVPNHPNPTHNQPADRMTY